MREILTITPTPVSEVSRLDSCILEHAGSIPLLGRFSQSDNIIPDRGNPIAFDRFTGLFNNPLRYSDPSGHCMVDPYDEYYDYECIQLAQELSEISGLPLDDWIQLDYDQLVAAMEEFEQYNEPEENNEIGETEGEDEDKEKEIILLVALNDFAGFEDTTQLTLEQRAETALNTALAFIVVDGVLFIATGVNSAALIADPEPITKVGLLTTEIALNAADIAVAFLHCSYAHWLVTGQTINSIDDLFDWQVR